MSTAVKTFAFAANSEGLADTGGAAGITFAWISDDGSPSNGCVAFTCTGALSSATEYARNASTGETWETWGVPGGSTVTHVQVTAYANSFAENGKVTACSQAMRIIDSAGDSVTADASADILTKDIGTADFVWEAGAAGSQIAVDADRQASNTDVRLQLQLTQSANNGNNSNYRLDTIAITVTYTAGAATNVLCNVVSSA